MVGFVQEPQGYQHVDCSTLRQLLRSGKLAAGNYWTDCPAEDDLSSLPCARVDCQPVPAAATPKNP